MRKWKTTLRLKDLWERRDRDELTVGELAEEVGKRTRALLDRLRRLEERFSGKKFQDLDLDTLEEIAESFEMLPEDISTDDFDAVLSELYDWADVDKRCWVKTF